MHGRKKVNDVFYIIPSHVVILSEAKDPMSFIRFTQDDRRGGARKISKVDIPYGQSIDMSIDIKWTRRKKGRGRNHGQTRIKNFPHAGLD